LLRNRAAANAYSWKQLDYNLLFRWFVGLNTDGAIWNATGVQ
jgi:hypothetical protein